MRIYGCQMADCEWATMVDRRTAGDFWWTAKLAGACSTPELCAFAVVACHGDFDSVADSNRVRNAMEIENSWSLHFLHEFSKAKVKIKGENEKEQTTRERKGRRKKNGNEKEAYEKMSRKWRRERKVVEKPLSDSKDQRWRWTGK